MIDLHLSKEIFNEVYLPYLTDYSNRFECYVGGSGSGKSVFVAQKLLYKALTYKRKILVVRKTLVSQKDSCWQLILDLLSKWHLTQYCKIRYSDYNIELPNGSLFLFKGLDDSERIKSIVGITDEWLEEATELSEEDFEQLNLRLRANSGLLQVFLSFNPISKANWVYKRFFTRKLKSTIIIKTTYKDNKFLPKEYIEALEQTINTNPTYYKIYALGEFCSLDKLVYNNWTEEEFDYHDLSGELMIGLDFGFANDLTALVASIKQDNTIYIFNEYTCTGKTNQEIAEIIKNLGFSKSTIIADCAEPKSIEELKRAGIMRIRESKKGPDSIIHGIQKLQSYKIVVHPRCTNIITELQNYSWIKDKQSGEYINKPIDQFNHSLDALRYSLQCINDEKKLRTLDKGVLGL